MRGFCLLACTGLFVLAGCGDVSLKEIKSSLRQTLAATGDSTLALFYGAREYAPYWTQQDALSREADSLLARLCHADADALDPADYDLAGIEALYVQAYGDEKADTARARALAGLEVALSAAFTQYARDLTEGRVLPDAVDGQWHMRGEPFNAVRSLDKVVEKGVGPALAAQHEGYAPLRAALDRYRALAAGGGWPGVSAPVGPGAAGPAVEALRQRLAATGDLESAGSGPFDAALAQAVQRFQARHGLPRSGRVDAATRAALNVPADRRVRQLELNLERRRWMPATLGATHVMVNIPDYRLYAYRNGKPALDMDVVVGRVYAQTPIFADTMQYVVFAPYWNVPPSITLGEIIPRATRNPGFLAANHYEVVAGDTPVAPARLTPQAVESGEVRVRQQPGPHNALGGVKFMFPNEYNIYLHDTPASAPFGQNARDFSHGCIRLADAAAFARFVLAPNGGWDEARIRGAMQAGEEQTVPLDSRLPVYITYLTAWVEGDGSVQFRDDVYGHDARLARALETRTGNRTRAACTAFSPRTDG